MTLPPTTSVLVTGGVGRLGGLVVETLRAYGYRALSLSRAPGVQREDYLFADLTDVATVRAALGDRPIDVVVHLAAAVQRDDALEVSARMDVSLEEIVRRSRPAHVVFASSGAVYGDGTPGALSEGSPTLGSSAYALSKLATEDLLRTLSEELPSLAVTALRIFNIAGPSFADSLVQRLLRADPDHPVQVRNPDSFVRDYIHQADTVLAVARAVERPRAGFRALNVGTGYAVSTRMLLESLAIPDEAWIEVPGVASTSWCDNAAMIRELDIVPHALPTRAWGAPTLH